VYYEGSGVEQYLHRRQDEAEREEAVQRSIIQDYAAVSDAHTGAYYRTREQIMMAGDLSEPVAGLVRNTASRLVQRHFPEMDGADYGRHLDEMVTDLQQWYGVASSGLWGLALDRLDGALEELLSVRLESLKSQLGDAKFTELARLLLLQCGDEVWKNYRDGLRSLTITSRLGNYGHKSAVADYIIHAADGWERFRDEAADLFLSRLLTFPLARLTEEPARREGMVELGRDIAMLVR
jgi:preprotein translocase subunit SecA